MANAAAPAPEASSERPAPDRASGFARWALTRALLTPIFALPLATAFALRAQDDGFRLDFSSTETVAVFVLAYLFANVIIAAMFANLARPAGWGMVRPFVALAATGIGLGAGLVVGVIASKAGLGFLGVPVGVVGAAGMFIAALTNKPEVRLGAGLLIVVCTIGVVALAAARTTSYRTNLYDSPMHTFGIVDEAELAERLPGWELGGYRDVPPVGQVELVTPEADFVSDERYRIIVQFGPTSLCDGPPTSGTCEPLQPLADGSPLMRWTSDETETVLFGEQPAEIVLIAPRTSGAWSIDLSEGRGLFGAPSEATLRTLLDSVLEPVSFEAWVEAT